MKTFHILIFGCQMNYADSARIKAILINCGLKYTNNIKDADIVIFDTCSVKQKAEDKITGKLKEIPENKKIWITGCMIQHNFRNSTISKHIQKNSIPKLIKKGNFLGNINSLNPEIIGINNQEIKNLKNNENTKLYVNHAFNPMFVNLKKTYPNLELMMRIDDIGFFPIILKKLGYNTKGGTEIINEYTKIIPDFQKTSTQKTAYIPISTGCNQFCSFCIVPYARGPEKYFPIKQIIEETKTHLQNGAEEIYLLGQIVNKHPDFITIIKEILKLHGLKRLRYTSPYPTYYSKELFELHQNEKKLCPHIHIPLQSGSDNILKNMFRGYTSSKFKTFIQEIQKLNRNISITTDIIVGFPNETEENFKKTLELVEFSNFDMIYIGIYSPRPGTYAHQKIPDNIPYEIKHQRRNELNNLLTKISSKNNQKEIGKIKEILINKITNKNGYIIEGHDNKLKTIEIFTNKINKDIKVGNFIKIKITGSKSLKLFGELI